MKPEENQPSPDDKYWRSDVGRQVFDLALSEHFLRHFHRWEVSRNDEWSRVGLLNFVDVVKLSGFKGASFGLLTFGLSKFIFYRGGAKYDGVRTEILCTASSEARRALMIQVLNEMVTRMFKTRTWLEPFVPIELDKQREEFVAVVPVTGLMLEEEEGYVEMHYPLYVMETMLMTSSDFQNFLREGEASINSLPVYL